MSFFVPAAEEDGALEITRVGLVDDRSRFGGADASDPVVSPVLSAESSVSGFDDCFGGLVGWDLCAPKMLCNGPLRCVFVGVGAGDVESAIDALPAAWWLAEEPAGVLVELEPAAVLVPAPLGEESDEPGDAGAAEAIPAPVKTATPTPNAAASPPMRPIYRDAFIALS